MVGSMSRTNTRRLVVSGKLSKHVAIVFADGEFDKEGQKNADSYTRRENPNRFHFAKDDDAGKWQFCHVAQRDA